jgi:hypothetical protein
MKDRIFVIGASHGGIEALSKLVAQLAANSRAPVFIAQHRGKRSSACACSIRRLRAPRKRCRAERTNRKSRACGGPDPAKDVQTEPLRTRRRSAAQSTTPGIGRLGE